LGQVIFSFPCLRWRPPYAKEDTAGPPDVAPLGSLCSINSKEKSITFGFP
jgi:hypothetical protein